MQPLQRNKEYLMTIGIYWPEEQRPIGKKIKAAAILIVLLICLGFGWLSSVVYIIKYVMEDPESALYALFQIAALISVFNGMLATIFCKQRVDKMIESFRIVHEEGKYFRSGGRPSFWNNFHFFSC